MLQPNIPVLSVLTMTDLSDLFLERSFVHGKN